MNYPNTKKGSVVRLNATFYDQNARGLILMTGGSATVRVVDASNAVVVNAACVISGYEVYYDWDTSSVAVGKYKVEFAATPPSGSLMIEPYEPLTIVIGQRLGE